MVLWVSNLRDSVLCARVLLLHNVLEKSERSCLTSYLYNAAVLTIFFLILLFTGVLLSEFKEKSERA